MFETVKGRFQQVLSNLATVDWTDVATALAVLAVFALARRPIARVTLALIARLADMFELRVSESFRALVRPASELFVFALGLYISLRIVEFRGEFGDIAIKTSISILVVSIFYAAYIGAELAAVIIQSKLPGRIPAEVGWIERVLKGIAILLGFASVLKVWGIDLGPLVTGVGVAGAAAAIAAQDLFRNLVGGLTNLAERRFHVGDWIRAEGLVEGYVEKVKLRSTAVRQFDQSLVHIPNGDLANRPLINVSRMRYRRISWTIGLHYATSVEQLRQIVASIKAYLANNDDFAHPPAARQDVYVDKFGDTAVDLAVYCFTRSTDRTDYLKDREALVLEVKRIIAEAGARFAHESRTIYVENAADPVPGGKGSKG